MADIVPSSTTQTKSSSYLSNGTYNFLKNLVTIVIPALATFYFTLAQIWNLPAAEEVVGTAAAVATFGGVVLKISSIQYNSSDARYDGSLDISESDSSKIHQLEITTPPEAIQDQATVTFKVNKVSSTDLS